MTTLKPRQRSITHVLEHAQTHHGIPLHTKDARNSTSDSARNSRARHSCSPIQMHHLEHYTGPEWHAHAHNHIYIYIIYIHDICLLSFIMIFMIKILMLIYILIMISDIPYINQLLAHPNALSRALDGPGVARPRTQPQKRHARVLSTCRDASQDPFALKRCVLETCCTSKLLAERPTSRPP